MRKLLPIVLLMLIINSMSSDELLFNNTMLISQIAKPKPIEIEVTATMYYATIGSCDDTPYVTAGLYHINRTKESKQRFIAL